MKTCADPCQRFGSRPAFARWRLCGAGMALVLLGGASCDAPPTPLEPIRIGVLSPRTGELGSFGTAWENAARLAAEQVNASGGLYEGRALELLFLDTGSLPVTARQRAQEALGAGAVALVGPASSSEVAETQAVVSVPQVSCCATSPALSARGDWFFRTAPSDYQQGQALAYLAAEGRDSVQLDACAEAGMVYRDDAYGAGLAAAFREAYEGRAIAGGSRRGRIVADVPYAALAQDDEGVARDAAAAFEAAFAAAHDDEETSLCVLLFSFPPDGAAVVRALQERLAGSAVQTRYLGTEGLNDNAFARLAAGASLDVVGTAPTHARNEAFEKFRNAYRARFGVAPGNLGANMYDAVMLMALAITQARNTGPERIRDALFAVSKTGRRFDGAYFGTMAEAILQGDDIDYVGPSGELDFDDAGDVVGDYVLWRPRVNAEGQYQIEESDFLPALEFAPAD